MQQKIVAILGDAMKPFVPQLPPEKYIIKT
jgi:hypothetical protein